MLKCSSFEQIPLTEMSNGSFSMDSFSSDYQIDKKIQHQQFADFGSLDDLFLDVVSPPFQSFRDEITYLGDIASQDSDLIESNKKNPRVFPSASLEILKKYGSRLRRLKSDEINVQRSRISSQKLSTETIIRLAAEEFIQSTQSSSKLRVLSHPYPSAFLDQSGEDYRAVGLVQNLLSCVQNVSQKQYERASRILLQCDKMSSNTGNPVQRLTFYFVEALYEKIDRETGTSTPKGLGKTPVDLREASKSPKCTQIACHKELPLSQITKFAGIQAIVEHVGVSRKIHIIDFEIGKGIHSIILMQALVARQKNPLEHLRITAVGTNSRPTIEETGRHLSSFAQSLNLHFSFNALLADDILDLNEELFDLDEGETVAVYAAYSLMNWIARPDCLEKLMGLVRALNPCVMIVSEVEANCNSPIFVDRFVEALFFYGAFFDSLADCLKDDEENRRAAESTSFSSAIRNIVATERDERKIRHMSIDVWRAYFLRFGFFEVELSMSSLCQANLLLKNFPCGDSCTFDMNGKSLIIGWKGTPLSSLSAWKFE